MTGYNLPPGCCVSDIPGNRPEDIEWERALEKAALYIEAGQYTTEEVRTALGELPEEAISELANHPLVRDALVELRAQELVE